MLRMLTVFLVVVLGCAPVPKRTGSIVESAQSPALKLSIDPGFEPLPPLKFPIENLTDAERRIFVEAAPGRSVRRLVVIQFEKVQAGSEFRFLYPSTPPRRFGAETYRFGTFLYDDERAAREHPEKEAGRTRAALSQAGFVPPRFYRVARLARVSDSDGMSEVIVFYMENADAAPPSGPSEDGDWPVPPSEEPALARRLEAAIHVLEG